MHRLMCPSSWVRFCVTCVVALSAVIGSVGCATDRAVISQADQVHGTIEPAVIEDRVLTSYLQAVGDRIVNAARDLEREGYGPKSHKSGGDNSWMFRDVRFHFVNSKTLNAFTTGGNHMYIYNQLFQECESEDELAAVMAHEYAHVYARHVHKGMNRQIALMGAALGAGAAGYAVGGSERGQQYAGLAAGGTAAIGQLIGMGFTRKDENEADKYGFSFYVRAGWDPDRFDDFFQHMIEKGLDTQSELTSDHPTLASRVRNTRERVERLDERDVRDWRREPVASPREFRELQDRARELGERLPSDQTLAAQQLLAAFPSCVTAEDQPDQVEARRRIAEAIDRQLEGQPRRR